jgi:alpha-L-fucosidase
MFIHWGLGRWRGETMGYIGKWIQARFRIPLIEYAKLAENFHPREFNAEEWVLCAKNASMKYIVFNAKHHDGFAMLPVFAREKNKSQGTIIN